MTEKPKPLDLRDMEKKIIEKAFEVEQVIDWRIQPKGEWDEGVIKEIVRRDVKIFSHVDYAVELRDVEELLEEIKHRIRKACEFYLRYKDKPELLVKEHPEYLEEVNYSPLTQGASCFTVPRGTPTGYPPRPEGSSYYCK